MNIYDEAEVITHEEIMRRIEENIPCSRDMFVAYINQQKKKDERAKKVEELLGLYREYRKGVIFYVKNSISNNMIVNAIKVDKLEKELEEMSKEYLGIEPIKDQKEIDMIFELYENSGVIHYQDMLKLKAYLTPPTQEEVCDGFTWWIEEQNKYGIMFISVEYNQETKTFWVNKTYGEFHYLARLDGIGQLDLGNNHYPTHLITLIGRFYEGLGK